MTLLLSLAVAATGSAQSDDTATDMLNKLLERKSQMESEDQQKLDEAKKKGEELLGTEEGKEVIKKAEEALAKDPDALLELGQKLLSDPDALKKGEALAGEKGISADALSKAREMMDSDDFANMLKSAASDAQKGGNFSKELDALTKSGVLDAQPMAKSEVKATLDLPAGVIPQPKDPIKIPIPRPNLGDDQKTTIEAEEAYFDTDKNEVMFQGNVVLNHPEFDLSCDILEVKLRGDANKAAAMPGQVAATGIDQAIAKGYVQIEKIAPDGKVQVAKSRLAVYNSNSGDVVLSDYPSLQSGKDLISGLSETTKIFLRADGTHSVDGKHRVTMTQSGNSLQFKPRP